MRDVDKKTLVCRRFLTHLSAPVPDISHSVPLRQSSHISCPPDRFGFTHTSLLTTLSSVQMPYHFSQAVQHECWRQAMQEELEALKENHTWDVVQRPPSIKPIGCKWVYSIKLNPDCTLASYKVRLVALGNRRVRY